MAGGRFFGLASHRIRPQNGWQISSRKHAAGNRLPAIWSAIGTGSLVSSSSEDFDQWAFAIDRRRHVPHGKTDLPSDSSVRSDGSALTMLLCTASGISVNTAVVHEILQSCFITPIYLCDWREEVLLIWMRSRGVIWVLPRAMNDALSRRFAER